MSSNRRPLSSRDTRIMQRTAAWLASTGITPNQISCIAMMFAALGGLLLAFGTHYATALVLAALMVQLRLLCNLFDGMVAVEGGKKTPTGELYNELPDRVSDSFFIIALGYAVSLGWLGWLAALLAALTAYIRVFGGSVGLPQSFRGPMAKQHRMAVLTVCCLIGAAETYYNQSTYALTLGLIIITIGSAATCALRIRDIANALKQRTTQEQQP